MVKNPSAKWETWARSLCWEWPWRRERLPTPVFLPGEFHGQRSLAGYSPWSCKELDMTDFHSLTHLLTVRYYCEHHHFPWRILDNPLTPPIPLFSISDLLLSPWHLLNDLDPNKDIYCLTMLLLIRNLLFPVHSRESTIYFKISKALWNCPHLYAVKISEEVCTHCKLPGPLLLHFFIMGTLSCLPYCPGMTEAFLLQPSNSAVCLKLLNSTSTPLCSHTRQTAWGCLLYLLLIFSSSP